MTEVTKKKPRVSFILNSDQNTIELYDEYLIDENIKNTACIPYLQHVHKTLCTKSSNPLKGVNKITFLKYTGLPCVIGERLFVLSDKDGDNFLSILEFISIILKANSSDMSIKMKMVFDIYDFDGNGFINAQDVKTILVHTINIAPMTPLQHNTIPLLDSSKAKE